jgi:gamma-glutamyltranspeptidase
MTAQEAVTANRIHDQIQPNKTCLERAKEGATTGHTEEQAKSLEEKGHTIEWLPRQFARQSLREKTDEVEATSTACAVKISYGQDGKVEWEAAGEPRKHMAGGKTYKANKEA